MHHLMQNRSHKKMSSAGTLTFTLEVLAELTTSRLVGDPHYVISGVADLETADPSDASFYSNPRYEQQMRASSAGVIFVDSSVSHIEGKNYLVSENPSLAFQQLIDLFYAQNVLRSGFHGIHSTAVIHETVVLEEDVSIGPYVVLDQGVKVGARSFIASGSYIGPNTIIGHSCYIHPRVVIRENCLIGNGVIIQAGAVIGSCGFGYVTDKKGHHLKLNQVGNVKIEDDVEIGANTTIDRSRFKSTVIGWGTKIDNLVQIGHGVVIGPHNIFVAQSGIAGSSSTGNHVIVGGQVGIAGHLHLDSGVVLAGKTGVAKSLAKGRYGGVPALPLSMHNRNQVYLRRIEMYVEQIKALEKRVEELVCGTKDL